jgi:hypothetical protein
MASDLRLLPGRPSHPKVQLFQHPPLALEVKRTEICAQLSEHGLERFHVQRRLCGALDLALKPLLLRQETRPSGGNLRLFRFEIVQVNRLV